MAEVTQQSPGVAPAVERPLPVVSWGAIFAGAFVSVGVWLLLHLLGVGIGLTAIRPDEPGSLRGVGIGTGVWSVIAPILALFIGGLVVGRLAGPLSGLTGAIHGTVMWSLATVAASVLLFMAVTAAVRGAVQTGTQVVSGTIGTVQEVVPADPLAALGLDPNDLVAPINERLAAQGRPTITADQLSAAMQDTLSTAIREGRLDRNILIASISENTALSRNDASQIATQVERRFEERRADLAQFGESAQATALRAAEGTGKAMIGVFIALLLGLLASLTGATLGVRSERRRTTRVPPRRGVAYAR